MSGGIAAECVDFLVIPVRDLERAASFYEGVLGFERDPLSHPAFPEYVVGNAAIALVEPESMGLPYLNTPPGQIALRVPDVEKARTGLEAAGVEFRGATFDSGVCHQAWFTDPDGNGLMLHRRYAPREG